MNNKHIAITIVAVLVVGVGAFFGGQAYAKSKTPGTNSLNQAARGQFRSGQGGQGGPGGFRGGANGGAVIGEILSKDDKSVTVKLQDGGSKIVFFSDSTTVAKTTEGSTTDLEVGKNVMVFGKTNDDGSVTAQNIQIRPALPPSNSTQPTTQK